MDFESADSNLKWLTAGSCLDISFIYNLYLNNLILLTEMIYIFPPAPTCVTILKDKHPFPRLMIQSFYYIIRMASRRKQEANCQFE